MTKQKYTKINLLLDSDVSFTQQEIKEELGLHILPNQLPAFKLFMLNFAEFKEPIAFSGGNNRYPPSDFNIHNVTYSTAQGVYKKLDKAKLATFIVGKPRGRKDKAQLSRLKPSKKLLNWVDKKFPYDDSIYLNAQTHVRLRRDSNTRKIEVDYKPTFYTKHVDLVMKDYHQKLYDWGYSLDRVAMDKVHMYCNFGFFDKDSTGNPIIRYGGRWWSEHNQISKKERTKRIRFEWAEGGDDLVELDFTSSILTAIRYWDLGREPETDHYKLFRLKHSDDGYIDREHIKNLTKLMLNRSPRGLEDAYGERFYNTKTGKPKKSLSLGQKIELYWLKDTARYFITKNHFDIRHWFFRGKRVGQLASFIETNLMLEIVRRCCLENIPVLTVYDSFIVPKKHEKRVYELMYEEDVLPFVKELINKDEQDSVERTLMGHLDWSKQTTKAIAKRAKTKGLTLLDYTLLQHTHLYQFDVCGHQATYNTKSIRDKYKQRCDICVEKERHEDAENVGLTYLGKGKDVRHGYYQFSCCPNKKEIEYHRVKDGGFHCEACWLEELQTVGKSHGLIVKDERKTDGDNTWFNCDFMECEQLGHSQFIMIGNIRAGSFECNTCLKEKHAREAEEAGVTMIGLSTRGASYREYKILKCMHTQEINLKQVRDKAFLCHTCEEVALDQPSMVYLLGMQDGDFKWLKLGYSKDLDNRVRAYGLIDSVKYKVLKTIDFDTGREALKFETSMHRKNTSTKLDKDKMKEYFKWSGHDECYKLEALDKLLEELESG